MYSCKSLFLKRNLRSSFPLFALAARPFSLPDHTKLTMPNLSPTMEKGNLARWLLEEGAKIAPGDIIAEVETDKATVDFEMQEEGYLAKILVPEGTKDIPIGELVAIIVEEPEDVAKFKDFKAEGAPAAAPAQLAPAAASPAPAAAPTQPQAQAPTPQAPAPAAAAGGRTFISPFAKKTAGELGIDYSGVVGSGPGGRIIKADIDKAAASPPPARAPAQAPAGTMPAYEVQELSQVRKVIAARLTESKQTIPHYYNTFEVEVDKLLAMRARLNAHAKAKVSVNDMLIKAASLACMRVPATNSSWQGDAILEYKSVDMSIAVQTDFGLITPIVRSADAKGLGAIAAEVKELAGRARENKLKPHEFQGGTFTISNLGMFGVAHFSAIINPPQACILAVGAAMKRVLPGAGDSEFRIGHVVSATLSSDHRVVDGAVAAQWGIEFKKFVEDPELMLL